MSGSGEGRKPALPARARENTAVFHSGEGDHHRRSLGPERKIPSPARVEQGRWAPARPGSPEEGRGEGGRRCANSSCNHAQYSIEHTAIEHTKTHRHPRRHVRSGAPGTSALAEAALAALPLAKCCGCPRAARHRAPPVASARDRLAMLRLATAGHARYRIDAAELERTSPPTPCTRSRACARELGRAQPLVLLLGSDSFLSLPSWLRWRELFDLAHIALSPPARAICRATAGPCPNLSDEIARRSARGEQLAAGAAGRVACFDMPLTDISASAVRAGLAAGAGPRAISSATVLAYIQAHRLYL